MIEPTNSAPAPSGPPPVMPSAPIPEAPASLAEFRAQKAAPPVEDPPPAEVVSAPTVHTAVEPPEPPDDGVADEAAVQADAVKDLKHRWKSETGVTLDLRRRDHRKIKRDYEELAALRQQIAQAPVRQAQPEPEPVPQADPGDPEPTLDQFAEEADPYLAHARALARWESRQEFKTQQATHTRVERARQAQRAIVQAQQAYDAELPQVKQRYPDFDAAHQDVLETLGRVPIQARAPIVQRLLTSPIRHDLTHYLGSHPDDMQALVTARSAHEQAFILGAIETRVRALVNQRTAAPIHPPATPPPAPMAPVGGTASPVALPDASKMNLAQFRANKAKFGVRA